MIRNSAGDSKGAVGHFLSDQCDWRSNHSPICRMHACMPRPSLNSLFYIINSLKIIFIKLNNLLFLYDRIYIRN